MPRSNRFFGPPIPNAPWSSLASGAGTSGGRAPAPTPQPGPGRGTNRPALLRVPTPDSPNFGRLLAAHTEVSSSWFNSMARQGGIVFEGADQWSMRTGGFVEMRAPTPNDDVTVGVLIGVNWVNTVTQYLYTCLSNAQGAAVWKLHL